MKTNIYIPPTFSGLTDVKVVRKTADETVNNSNVYQDDNELKFAVSANEVWEFNMLVMKISAGGAAQDTKFKFTIPLNAEIYWANDSDVSPIALNEAWDVFTSLTDVRMQPKATSLIAARFFGIYVGGNTAGTVQLQWAQSIAEAVNHTVKANSYIIARKLA